MSETQYTTIVVPARSEPERIEAISRARAVLSQGMPVVFPTDTVYGVGCDVWSAEAIDRLYLAKRRPRELPIPVLVSSVQHIARVATGVPAEMAELAMRFWPGGLTVILERRSDVPEALGLGQNTVAVRMPDHPVALGLIEAMGGAMAVTSANISGAPTPATAEDGIVALEGRVPMVLDGGDCPGGLASTIINLAVSPPKLLRAGPLSVDALRLVLPGLEA